MGVVAEKVDRAISSISSGLECIEDITARFDHNQTLNMGLDPIERLEELGRSITEAARRLRTQYNEAENNSYSTNDMDGP